MNSLRWNSAVIAFIIAALSIWPKAGESQIPQKGLDGARGAPTQPPSKKNNAKNPSDWPTGASWPTVVERPTSATKGAVCSFHRAVCVHYDAKQPDNNVLFTLTALERAYEHLVLTLGLPAPLSDSGQGGSDALDFYLHSAASPLTVERAISWEGEWARASAFCVSNETSTELIERAVVQCLGEAIALSLDASETPYIRRAFATHLWFLLGKPTTRDFEVIDDWQANPQLALLGRELNRFAEASGLLFEYLDIQKSATEPGRLSTSLYSLSANPNHDSDWQWHNEPDVFDVLRHSFGKLPSQTALFMSDFAVTRAFLGERDHGSIFPTFQWAGWFGRVRFEWRIPFSSLPRRLAPARPIEPTGSTYIWLDLDDVTEADSLAVRADWEAPVAFQWTLVRLDSRGQELGRINVKLQELGTSAEQSLVGLSETAAILIIGTNLGGMGPSHPFDPDVAPYEPHSYTVYLAQI